MIRIQNGKSTFCYTVHWMIGIKFNSVFSRIRHINAVSHPGFISRVWRRQIISDCRQGYPKFRSGKALVRIFSERIIAGHGVFGRFIIIVAIGSLLRRYRCGFRYRRWGWYWRRCGYGFGIFRYKDHCIGAGSIRGCGIADITSCL